MNSLNSLQRSRQCLTAGEGPESLVVSLISFGNVEDCGSIFLNPIIYVYLRRKGACYCPFFEGRETEAVMPEHLY